MKNFAKLMKRKRDLEKNIARGDPAKVTVFSESETAIDQFPNY